MQGNRQDAWTKDEDVYLAETVLRYIREGKTQLEAFKEVGKKLSRTSAACGFRWNATLRNQYEEAIQLAREKRKQTSVNTQQIVESDHTVQPNIHEVVQTLEQLHSYYKNINNQEEINKLVAENYDLKQEVSYYKSILNELKQILIKQPS